MFQRAAVKQVNTADGLNRLIGRMLKVIVEPMGTLSLDESILLPDERTRIQ